MPGVKEKDVKAVPYAEAYPRPQLQRGQWVCLNGEWEFAIDREGAWTWPGQVKWKGTIVVPFSPETPLSGVKDTGFYKAVWYRRVFNAPKLHRGQRVMLHFGAVDYRATAWVNGIVACQHEGGYTPFQADVTDLLDGKGEQTIVVHAEDDPQDLAKPRGKQDWQLNPHSIWYPRTTGIWQTVWMEVVPASYIRLLRWSPSTHRWDMAMDAFIGGQVRDDLHLRVRLSAGDRVLAEDTYAAVSGEIRRQIGFSDPGIDDYRNELLWTPQNPVLIDAEVQLTDGSGKVIDAVRSYTAMRQISLLGNRFVLNGKPMQLQLVLDQGYWADGGLTAPDDAALKRDVELVKAMGFNGVRLHQKIENPRFLYWADRLGLFVWEEMPSPYRFSPQTVTRLTEQWAQAIERDISHPCIIAWVPFNESWGVPDLPDSPAQRHCVQAMYHLTKTLDPTRPVIGNDGWEATATDIVAIHDYDADPQRLAQRYSLSEETVRRLFENERPGHRILFLQGFSYAGQPIMLTEFGGIAYSKDVASTWGYSRAPSAEQFADRYAAIVGAVRSLPLLAGFCYTQFADTYQEANGLVYMDRTPKFPLEQMAVATRGPRTQREHQLDAERRQRVLAEQRSG